MIEIRRATFDDIPAMIDLGKRGHSLSEMAHLKFDVDGARLVGAACIASKDKCAFVAEHDGEVVGLLIGQEQPYVYLKARYATDLVAYAVMPGAGAKLMRRFIAWAFEERRVEQVLLGVSFGGKSARATEAFYKKLGARHIGGMFVLHRGA